MRIAVGMSGGVDSSVAAARLVEAGHDVVGVTMLIWPDSKCCGADSVRDAAEVAEKLGIRHELYDLMPEFKREVVDPFLATYSEGRTPNPCPTCNEKLKFQHMWEAAQRATGATILATGHYARVRQDPETGRFQLLRGVDPRKDQSYMLWRLGQEQLARLWTPLGDFTKEQTRDYARQAGFLVADKPDSQDLCFTSDDLSGFLAKHLPEAERPGPIVSPSGEQLGEHRGTTHYTIGQRKGLGLAVPEPLYVLEILPQDNTLVVGTREQTLTREFEVEDVRWTSIAARTGEFRAEVKVRHGVVTMPASISPLGDRLRVTFDEPQGSVAPGQYAVFHEGDLVIGGGTITR